MIKGSLVPTCTWNTHEYSLASSCLCSDAIPSPCSYSGSSATTLGKSWLWRTKQKRARFYFRWRSAACLGGNLPQICWKETRFHAFFFHCNDVWFRNHQPTPPIISFPSERLSIQSLQLANMTYPFHSRPKLSHDLFFPFFSRSYLICITPITFT